MNKKQTFINAIAAFILMISIGSFNSCKENNAKIMTTSLIPNPVSVELTDHQFEINKKTMIWIDGDSEELLNIGTYFAELLGPATAFDFPIATTIEAPTSGIYFSLQKHESILGEEGYKLKITEDLISLSANEPAGIFRGIQTVRQLLIDKIELSSKQMEIWTIPTGIITDYPEYSYRSSMLDVSRHFFSVEDVKQYIDYLAFYKFNYFHLHLTDDQGWRIEIKSWPKLTEIGGSTQVGGGKGGFYTQEEYLELVEYATDRYITIVPEIEMPGHSNAALASYAFLNCNDTTPDLYTGTDVGFSTFCTSKDSVYLFIDDVIREVAALTPGPYIHVGGDESHATKKDDYHYFINKVQEIVAKHGKTMMGWDETAQANLKDGSVVQLWASPDFAKEAISKGAKLIMSPASKIYLDMQYDSTTPLGLHWAGYIEVDTGYIWDPANLIEGIGRENILGIEAPLWTETILNMDDIEFMVFPRLCGYADIGWSQPSKRDWEEYKVRLAKHKSRFEAMGINFYPSEKVLWE